MFPIKTATPSPLRLVNPFPMLLGSDSFYPFSRVTRLDRRVLHAIQLWQADLSKAWYVEELAAAVHLCPRQLERLFQQQTGFTPLQYLKRLRLEQATELLPDFALSIQEVSLQIGYESASQFGADFKRVFGRTPRQYRQQGGWQI